MSSIKRHQVLLMAYISIIILQIIINEIGYIFDELEVQFFLLMIANVLEMNRVAAAAGSQSNHFCYWHVDDS